MAKRSKLQLPGPLAGQVWAFAAPNRVGEPHTHDELEFNLATAGRATYLVEDRRYDLAPGSLIWLYRDQPHLLVDLSPDFQMWIAVFRPGLVESVCQDEGNLELTRSHASRPIARSLPAEAFRTVHRLCEQVSTQDTHPDLHNAGLGYLLISAWRAFRDSPEQDQALGVHPAVERVARLLRDDPQPRSIEQLADLVQLTPSHLSQVFARQLGVSLTAYRQRCCIERFIDIFGRGNRLNMTSAALAAGFGSYAQFHRVFKQHFGFGPAAYRRRIKDDG